MKLLEFAWEIISLWISINKIHIHILPFEMDLMWNKQLILIELQPLVEFLFELIWNKSIQICVRLTVSCSLFMWELESYLDINLLYTIYCFRAILSPKFQKNEKSLHQIIWKEVVNHIEWLVAKLLLLCVSFFCVLRLFT